ncbi:MAG: hemerythrin domain-containing protein, partial [Thioalkalivibrio sp.]
EEPTAEGKDLRKDCFTNQVPALTLGWIHQSDVFERYVKGVFVMSATNIYDALRESHEIQRALFRKLLRSKPGSQGRTDLFTLVRHELSAHEAAEERYLYVPMMMHDLGLEASRHALHEHHQVDELVEHLEELDPSGEAWIKQVKALSHKVHHHLREEETKFFQMSGKLLNAAQKTRLAGQYRRDYLRMHQLLTTEPL